MKKYLSIALVCLLTLSMLTAGVSAQAENKLTTSWEKGLAGAVEQKTDADGTAYASATGIDKAWLSPFLNVYDAVKAVVGNEEEVEVMFAFEVRIQYKNEEDKGIPVMVHPLIRANECSDDIKDTEKFPEVYEGELFANKDKNVMAYFDVSTIEVTDEWAVFESSKLVSKTELNDAWWKRWDLCVDQISDPEIIASLEFRNAGVYNAEDYESMIPEPTEAPATPEPTPTEVTNTPVGLTSTTAPAASPTATEITDIGDKDQTNGNTTTIVIVCVVAAVVVAAVIIGVVTIKKKKSADASAEEPQDENKNE